MDYLALGSLAVVDGTRRPALGGLRQRAVLAALLLSVDRTVSVDALIEQVWNSSPPPKALASVRAYIANLRRLLDVGDGAHRLVTDGYGYRLQLGGDRIDTRLFESQLGHGKRLLAAGDPAAAATALTEALALWRGAPLADFRDLTFAQHEIHRLEALRADVVEARYEAELACGGAAELIGGLEAEVSANPLREKLWGQLMLALYRSGRRTDALAAHQRLRQVLDEELGVGPSAALSRLASQIHSEAAELSWSPPPTRRTNRSRAAAPLYGRVSELTRLHDALICAADGCGTVAVVTGESGVGKTALAAEAARLADDLGMAVVWVGHAGGVRKPPSWAWMQVLRTLAARTAQLPGAAEVAPDLGPAGDQTGFAYLESLANAVAEAAGRGPTLIVLDDLHRADRTTRDVLELLTAFVARRPLLILATWQDGGLGRPLRESEFDRLMGRCDIAMVRLRGLGRAATAELIQNVAGAAPSTALVDSVERRTGGNPFYITELTRMLRDGGGLTDSSFGADDVPDAVAGVIRRRMADLPAQTRTALTVAALLGGEFSVDIAAEVLGRPVAELTDDLREAERRGLIVSAAPRRMRFAYGLVRDAIAAGTSGSDRIKLHADIARAYAGADRSTPENAFAGAEHAWRAGPELDTDTARSLLDPALATAWRRSAYHEAADLSAYSLDVAARMPLSAERREYESGLLLQQLTVKSFISGQNSTVVQNALRRFAEIDPDSGEFSIEAVFRGLEGACSGRLEEAALLAEGLVAAFGRSGDAMTGSAAYYLHSLVCFIRGALDDSAAAVDVLLDGLPEADWRRYGRSMAFDVLMAFDVRGYGIAAWIAAMRGDADGVRNHTARGVSVAAARNDTLGRSITLVSELQARAVMGRVAGTAAAAAALGAELTENRIAQLAASAHVIEGWAAALSPGGLDTTARIREAIEVHRQDGTQIFLPLYLQLLADAESAQDRVAEASAALDAAEAVAAATGERVWDAQLAARRLTLRAAGRTFVPVTA